MCRFTGVLDIHNNRVFADDIIVAGRWHTEITKDGKHREYKEYSGVLKVVYGGYYWGLEVVGDLRYEYGFIEGCDESLDELVNEYFIEKIGSVQENIGVAYDFWSKYGDKKNL